MVYEDSADVCWCGPKTGAQLLWRTFRDSHISVNAEYTSVKIKCSALLLPEEKLWLKNPSHLTDGVIRSILGCV